MASPLDGRLLTLIALLYEDAVEECILVQDSLVIV